MIEERQRAGSCLCGAVTVRANVGGHVGACHCGMCRRWGGAPMMAVPCSEVEITGGEVRRFRSSDWAERGFCAACGTHLFFQFLPTDGYHMPAGLFDQQSGLDFDHEIYIDRKPDWYAFAGERKRQTEAEFLASMGAGGEGGSSGG
jgi:hypothetical protein